jgi:bifunctional non-homologous end joining protein LigD
MNPADKRLAIRTEDHPFQYARFEGAIPPGQYGAGPSWDIESARFDRSVPTGRSLKEIKEEGMGESVQTTWVPERERWHADRTGLFV